jgi:TamB, inner membrane protein subunit of TAM complex
MAASTPRRRLRLVLRIVLIAIGAVFAVQVIILLLLLVRPARERMLAAGLPAAWVRLPGTLVVGRSSWPDPRRLEFRDVVWTADADTLLCADLLAVTVDLGDLLQRNLRVTSLRVNAVAFDLPRFIEAFRRPERTPVPTPAEPRSLFFPRAGAIPGVPAIAVDTLDVRVARLRATPTMTLLEVAVLAAADLTAAHGPWLRIAHAAAHDADGRWGLSVADLEVDGEKGHLAGRATADLDSLGTVQLDLATAASGELQVRATLGPPGVADARRVVLQLASRPDRQGLRLRSLPYQAELSIPGTAELATWPGPARRAGRLPDLGSLHIDATGVVTLRPRFAIETQTEVTPRDWLETLRLRLEYDDGTLQVDSLRVGLPGLRAEFHAHRSSKLLDAAADVEIANARWISVLSPGTAVPESLVATLRCTAHGAPSSPALQARLQAAARWGASRIDPCILTASYPDGPHEIGTVQLTVGTRGLVVESEARLALVNPLKARLAPIRVRTLHSAENGGTMAWPRDSGSVEFDPASGDLHVEGVRIVGALGTAAVRADMQDLLGGFGLDWEWSEPPVGLWQLLGLQAAVWDSVGQRWERDAPFGIHVSGRRRPTDGGTTTSITGDVHLPGPRTLSPLLGSHVRLDDLGPVDATISVELVDEAAARRWSGEADLTSTEWLRSANLRARGNADDVEIEDLQLGFEDLSLVLSATRRDSVLGVHTQLKLESGDVLRRFVALDPADTLRIEATGTLEGTIRDPRMVLDLVAAGHKGAWSAPRLSGHVDRRAGRWSARLEAPKGLSGPLPLLQLDSLSIAFDSEQRGTDPFPGSLDFEARGPRFTVVYGGIVTRDTGWEARGDTLGIVLRGKDLRSSHPFVVGMRDGRVRFEDLLLEGTLGRVQAAGSVGQGLFDLESEVVLQLGGFAFVPSLPPAVWPQRVELRVQAQGQQSFQVQGTIEDFALGSRPALVARIDARADSSRVVTHVEIVDGSSTLLSGKVDLVEPWKRAMASPMGTFDAEAELASFPVPWEFLGRTAESMPASTLDAHLLASGTFAEPQADLAVGLRIPVENGPPAEMRAALTLGSGERRFAATPEVQGLDLGRMEALRAGLGGYGLATVLQLGRAGKNELQAEGAIPLQIAEAGRPQIGTNRPLRLHVDIPGLELADWQELLPPGNSLGGRLVGLFDVQGAVENPELQGSLSVTQITLATRDGLRAGGLGELTLRGSGRRPVLQGKITVTSALVPIPDEPRKLLPVEGSSLLREAVGAVADSIAVQQPAVPQSQAAPTQLAGLSIQPNVDVELIVPSGCWIKGRNLSVELSGKLQLRQKGPEPTVLGELQARQGTLAFLGRTFQLDRGQVQFFGEDETNPTLDVRLSTKISSTTVRILVSGTAQEPKVDLVSEPEMSQSDIMSLLVFGREKDELDGDELQLVAQRSAAMAAMWGAAELQGLSGTLGVDMLRLQPGATPSGESSVVVGKYLSERALLKYEQALDSTTGFYVALEYTLTRNLTVETQAGTWQSGAELNWSKDY